MSYNNISGDTVSNEIEAYLLNESRDKSFNEKEISDLIKSSVTTIIEKLPKTNKKLNNSNNLNNVNTFSNSKNLNYEFNKDNISNNVSNNLNNVTSTFKAIKFEPVTSFSECNYGNSNLLNSKSIAANFYSDLEIKEYTVLPKDEESYFDEYKNYFTNQKRIFLEQLKITLDDPFLELEKFIFVVIFDSFQTKVALNEIILVDPLKNYSRYNLKFESDSCYKDFYFFSGQIIYVEGILKHSEMFATKIVSGMPLVQYDLQESYVKAFYSEVNIYLISG